MKPIMLAIHDRPGSFSDQWIEYCATNGVDFRRVNCYSSNIVSDAEGCDALLWHFVQNRSEDLLVAKAVLESVAAAGMVVFPDRASSWHFDDKLAQKYLFEALGIPHVASYVFLSQGDAEKWAESASYPVVFKLKGGAGSTNVRLITDEREARRVIRRAFSSGFPSVPRFAALSERLWHVRRDKTIGSVAAASKGIYRAIRPHPQLRRLPRQANYVYFQQFIPNNQFDIRVVVIGKRAFAVKRMVRKGDFRASGSGNIEYDPLAIPLGCVEAAFNAARRLGAGCLAFDFVLHDGAPLIVEVSFGFNHDAYLQCPGYWTEDMTWVSNGVRPTDFILEDVISLVGRKVM